MGRGVEDAMLQTVAKHAGGAGCTEVYAEFIPTAKNQPCDKWLTQHPALTRAGRVFRLPLQGAVAATEDSQAVPARRAL
jgi:hypothetical protein